jgi:hypothetical protein
MRNLWFAPVLLICCVVSCAGAQIPNDRGEPGIITGKVLNLSGQPLRGARVCIREHYKHKEECFDM